MPDTLRKPEDTKTDSTLSQLSQERATESNVIQIPQITLPKGGGALKGIDEKFQVNPVNGTSSFSIPLPLSPNRNGFTPQLSLSYNSGVGNGLFGIGWDMDLPSIQRRTDKKLPRYFDSNDDKNIKKEDSFMFSGIEELVPLVFTEGGTQKIKQITDGDFIIRQYRPRIEGGFSRIERIEQKGNGFYWRVTSRDNITTFFGFSPECRIADPNDATKIFQWLPEFSFDDKGLWVWYEYKAEDLKSVVNEIHEKNRFNGNQVFANKHLKRIKYGNQDAYFIDTTKPYQAQLPVGKPYFFELVLDYGEHNTTIPTPTDNGTWAARKDPFSAHRAGFEIRNYRLCKRVLMFHTFPNDANGKERLNNATPTLVHSLDFEYDKNVQNEQVTEVTYLTGITQKGYVKKADSTYSAKELPKMTFDYQWLQWNKDVKDVSRENLVHAPVGLSGNYQWVDLYNEGINGILTEQANGWFYKSNLGENTEGGVQFTHAQPVMPKPSFMGLSNGVLQLQDLDANGEKQIVVTSQGLQGYFDLNFENDTEGGEWQPFKSFLKTLNLDLHDPNVRMIDVNGDGKPEIVLSDLGAFWFWENEGKIGYDAPELATKPYDEELGAAIVFSDQEQRIFLADMSGDGLTDIVRIRNGEVCYWANMGYGRFGGKVTMNNSPVFDNPEMFNPSYIQLADISGTGATDIIYFGKNKFNAYLNFSGNAWSKAESIDPFFPTEQPNKITVTDLLGNGTACLVWSSEMPAYSAAPMRFIDLMGGKKPHIMVSHENGFGKKTVVEYKSSTQFYLQDKRMGTAWITRLAFPVQCVSKTIVTEGVTNVRFTSQYSYHHGYYDHAEREFRGFGRVEQIDAEDFDVFEKTAASNVVSKEHHQPPVLTKTWFHTGAFLDKERILTHFKKEYWTELFKHEGFTTDATEYELPDAVLLAAPILGDFNINTLSAEQWREALRACKGMTLRQEVFGLDAQKRIADEKQAKGYADNDPAFLQFQAQAGRTELVPFSVATHNCEIQLLQERNQNRYAVFTVKESEAITYAYERNPEDPRIAHTLTLETDDLNNVLEAVSVVYPRQKIFVDTEGVLKDAANDDLATRNAKKHGRDGQLKNWITLTKNDFTNDIILPEDYHLRKGFQTRTYELTGFQTPVNALFSIKDFKNKFNGIAEIEYHKPITEGVQQKRLIEHVKTKFYNADLTAPLPDGQQAIRGINYEAYQLAYTRPLIDDIFTPSAFSVAMTVSDLDMRKGKFLQENTDGSPVIENPTPDTRNPKSNWWIRSGTVQFRRDTEGLTDFTVIKNRFFAPVGYTDPFETKSEVFYDPLNLFMEQSVDMLKNETKVLQFNFRTLSPVRMMDVNENISSALVDELGMVKAAAIEGKSPIIDGLEGNEADNLLGFTENTEGVEVQMIQTFFNLANTVAPQICNSDALQQAARALLGNASARMVYDFSKQPTVVASIAREQHAKLNPNNSPLQISFEYSDGLGKVAMKKVQAESGSVKQPDGTIVDTGTQIRWIGNGRTVLNNKGNPIKQYEPYFSTTPAYENDPAWVEQGVTPIIYYDGAGRNVKTELPDGTFTKIEFDAWKQVHFDLNDTVKDSAWYQKRLALPNGNADKNAAIQSEIHHNTPSVIILDTLGRPTLGIDHNKWAVKIDLNPVITKEEKYYTFSDINIEGNALSITDARGNVVMQYCYDMLGHRVAQTSMDAGKRWMLNNALGNPVKTWDERKHEFSFDYDVLHRPIAKRVTGGDGQTPLNLVYESLIYGEDLRILEAKAKNLLGKAAILYDSAGKVVSENYDFKGNLLRGVRQFAKDYKNAPNWDTPTPDSLLENANYTFASSTEYDALNRPIKQTAPDGSVNMPTFNAAGLLETVNVKKGNQTTPYVKNIDYDEKGQRIKIQYGNGVTTKYTYDPETFRLTSLKTTAVTPPLGAGGLQDLLYTYDPTGNITQIVDKAIPTVFFNNQKIEGQSTYAYDALYRLIEATGREQNTNSPNFNNSDNWNDAASIFSYNSGNPMAMRNYTQRYQYDSVGNILQLRHTTDTNGSWTRDYVYETQNNRLKTTAIGNRTDTYPHHAQHGYIETLPHLQSMAWTFKEELQATTKQADNNGTPETTYYVYDGAGQRARKITENATTTPPLGAGGLVKDERIYVGGFEVYRNANDIERETLHIMDDKQRIAMIETRTKGSDEAPTVLTRYQLGNHLGSVSLEMDENAAVISYEEYHPYGTTAYQAQNRDIKAAAKRYRYTGMERDEETGLAYHSARYYVVWLGRWLSCDPIGVEGGMNLYGYCSGNPQNLIDKEGLANGVPNPEDGTFYEENGTQYFTYMNEDGLTISSPVEYIEVKSKHFDHSETHNGNLFAQKNNKYFLLYSWQGPESLHEVSRLIYQDALDKNIRIENWTPQERENMEYATALNNLTAKIAFGAAVVPAILIPGVPEVAGVAGAYDGGVSAVELTTGKSSGAHISNLVTGNIDSGRPLSTYERVKAGFDVAIALLPLAYEKYSSSSVKVASGNGGTWSSLPATPAAARYAAQLRKSGSMVPLENGSLTLKDLGSLASSEGAEFGVIRLNGERFVIRGEASFINLPLCSKLICHVHPGGLTGLKASADDYNALRTLGISQRSAIIGEGGAMRTFGINGGSNSDSPYVWNLRW